MAIELTLPALAENIESARVVSVLVSVGTRIEPNQTIAEVETDKATAEVPASAGGIVKSVAVKPGEDVHVGDVLVTVEEEAPGPTEAKPDQAREAAPVRDTGPSRRDRDQERPTRAIAEQPPREPDGGHAPAPARPARAEPAEPAVSAEPPAATPIPAGPSTRRLARELAIDLRQVRGTGPDGRIGEDDLLAHVRGLIAGAAATAGVAPVSPPPAARRLPDFAQWGEVTRQPMDGIRRRTAEVVAASWAEIPHVTQFDRADITRLEELRRASTDHNGGGAARPTITAVLTKIVAAALHAFPQFNASLDPGRGEIVLKRYLHIGVAVDTPRGLIVPVVRDVDRKGLTAVAAELGALADKARAGRIALGELQGGTFTITNLGGLGTTAFGPIIRWPEVAILGVGKAEPQPVLLQGAFVPRTMLPLCLSYDHRLIDGADAARFLRWIAATLENPLKAALDGALAHET